jgi:exopolysaccharide biosynthesis protein
MKTVRDVPEARGVQSGILKENGSLFRTKEYKEVTKEWQNVVFTSSHQNALSVSFF